MSAVAVSTMIVAGSFSSGPLAGASPTPTYKYYSVQVAPAAVLVGSSGPIAVDITNSPASNQAFGSVELTLPATWVVTNVSSPRGWTAQQPSSSPGVILLTSVKSASIAPGKTLTVTLTTEPLPTGRFAIGTEVKQSNDFSGTGNDFNFDATNSSTTVEVVSSATIAFDQQPTDVQQSVPSKSNFSYMCPPVSVQAVASDGTPVGDVFVTVTNGGPGDPGLSFNPASLSAGTTTNGAGIATFGSADCSSGIAASNLGSGYTLSASSPSMQGSTATSAPFSVVQLAMTCTTNPCMSGTITSQSTGTTGSASVTFGTPGYKLVGSFGLGNSLSEACTSNVTNGNVTVDPLMMATPSTAASGVVTMTFPKSVVNNLANNGTPLMQVCAGASEPFPGSNTTPLTGNYPYQGLLPDCPADYLTAGGFELCVISRSKKAANETIRIFASDLSDPSFW